MLLKEKITVSAVTLAVAYLHKHNISAPRDQIWSAAYFWSSKLYQPNVISVATFILNGFFEDVSREELNALKGGILS